MHEFEALLDHRIKNELGRHRRKLLLETYASDICVSCSRRLLCCRGILWCLEGSALFGSFC